MFDRHGLTVAIANGRIDGAKAAAAQDSAEAVVLVKIIEIRVVGHNCLDTALHDEIGYYLVLLFFI